VPAEIDEKRISINRRAFVAGASGLAATAALRLNRASAQEATPSLVADRTVETIHGPVVVPGNPQRIVAVNFPSAVALLELGVTPVGITRYMPALPDGYPDITKIEIIENEAFELDLEKILSLQPDLILGADWKDPAQQSAPYEQLSAIAPTALFEWQQAAGNWAGEAAGCAEAIGKTAEFEALRKGYEDQAALVKETYAAVTAEITWDIISASETNWYLYGPSSSHGKVAVAAGIQLNAAGAQAEGYRELSFEEFNLLAETGAILIRSAGDATLATLPGIPTYTSLPAVTAGHVVETPYYFPSSYGLSKALLADIEDGLKALAG
jgi:iron complex transport system substrate-binding protein